MYYEQKIGTTFKRISGDVVATKAGVTVTIPYTALHSWSEAERNEWGIYRREDAAVAPPNPNRVPDRITNFQARAALMGAGLFDAVDQWAKALGVGHPGFQAWEYANEFFRNGALLKSLATQFGMSDKMLDDLFIAGSKIDP